MRKWVTMELVCVGIMSSAWIITLFIDGGASVDSWAAFVWFAAGIAWGTWAGGEK